MNLPTARDSCISQLFCLEPRWSLVYYILSAVHWLICLFKYYFPIKTGCSSTVLIQDGTDETLTSTCVNQEIYSETWKYVKRRLTRFKLKALSSWHIQQFFKYLLEERVNVLYYLEKISYFNGCIFRFLHFISNLSYTTQLFTCFKVVLFWKIKKECKIE